MADLHRRGVGAQQALTPIGPGRQIEGVLHVPGRMVGRDVEGGEVVVIAFHLRPLGHAVAQAREDVEDLLHRGLQGMAVARRHVAAGGGHIKRLAGDAIRHGRGLEMVEALPQQALHLLLEHVRPLPHLGPLLAGKAPHRPEHPGEAPLLAEQVDPQLL